MDYVKEVQEWDKQTKRAEGGWVRRVPSEDVNTERNALEQQRGSSLRMVEQPREEEKVERSGGESRRNGRVLLGVERGE